MDSPGADRKRPRTGRWWQVLWGLCLACLEPLAGQANLVANPGFEQAGPDGFATTWAEGEFGKLGKTVFLDRAGAHQGQNCLRLAGTPNTWTTCAGQRVDAKPDTDYWVTWWFKAEQPASSRTYLFLQTNTGQRVFPHTDRHGNFDWVLCIARYHTRADELWLSPVLTMQTVLDHVGTSWWDDVNIAEHLTPELEAAYRQEHPWDDLPAESTARALSRLPSATVWTDRPEARIYPNAALPATAPDAAGIHLAAPGNGHDACQLVVSPVTDLAPLRLEFTPPAGPGPMAPTTLSCRIVRCVDVQDPLSKTFPKGLTPDPLVPHTSPEPAAAGHSVVFWLEWAPPVGSAAGEYRAEARLLSGDQVLVNVPLTLRRWGCELPAVPHYRSMVLLGGGTIRRFYPGLSDMAAMELAWDLLGQNRLSGFNLAAFPTVQVKDGAMVLDWSRFDQILAAAQRYRATALTIGPMFGGGCSEGWKPRFKLAGQTPLADPGFDSPYRDLNRQIAERLRQAGLLDKAYVYPYDEPEGDYMDKIAGLCDLIHQGAPDLKVLMTTDPATGQALWGKVNAWIVPWSRAKPDVIGPRRQAGDEIWIYNMTASIESTPLAHRAFMWHALDVDAAGGLLWNACWWNGINPWENPTAKPVPVGRTGEQLYHYSAGQASLFYPALDGQGPLVPSLRLALIRQGVEDFDLLTSLVQTWREQAGAMPSRQAAEAAIAASRKALIAPVVLDGVTSTANAVRVEALRHLIAGELARAAHGPPVIACFGRSQGRLQVAGCAAAGTALVLNDEPVPIAADGTFRREITPEALAAGLRWSAANGAARTSWTWPGVR